MNKFHETVLLKETIDLLNVQKDKHYIDATLGGGGHSLEILKRGGKVLGIDADSDAIEYVKQRFGNDEPGFKINQDFVLAKGNFKDINIYAREFGFESASGIIFDLGVSSYQLETAERGFSFQREGPLDMRMDLDLKIKAAELVNILTKGELYELFNKLGEERFARAIADGIVSARQISPIKTTTELVEIVKRAVPRYQIGINPGTRIFQALRIAVNDELNSLRDGLIKAFAILEEKGRICVITFHSLEDRIVKNQFKAWNEEGIGVLILKKPLSPSLLEVEKNRRSRSAKLRVIEKI